jgi:deoxyribodipyrimidine photo-lyase
VTSIWWIRRDLRLTDNAPLQSALGTGPVLPVFILDPSLLSRTPLRRQAFLFEGLHKLDTELQERGSRLIVRKGEPVNVLLHLIQETGAERIFAEEDYTPYARSRDARAVNELPLQLILGQTVHPPEFIKKSDGRPYTVYTPYSRVWKSLLTDIKLIPAPEAFPKIELPRSEELPALPAPRNFPAGEAEAVRRLNQFINLPIGRYSDDRNRMDLDGTSSLSPYIRFGMLGLRQAVSAARQAMVNTDGEAARRGAEVWLNELIWREFYIQILYHFPAVSRMSFNPALAHIPWRNVDSEFKAWSQGCTGVPIVDAAMRQLKETGWMHNRARMIVASYLVKDLLIDWRRGEAWFMQNLLDGDPAANNGGWQWVAGTGTDAAPYFRIFNPVLQSARFDPDGNYIRKWVPELRDLPSKVIHAPWEKGIKVQGYPEKPIIEREIVKQRTLNAYSLSKERTTA